MTVEEHRKCQYEWEKKAETTPFQHDADFARGFAAAHEQMADEIEGR